MNHPNSWLGLAHKTAVVTGAASGIGKAVAKSLLEQGCHVIMADKDKDSMNAAMVALGVKEESISGISSNNGYSSVVECDVSKEHDVKRLFHESSFPPTSKEGDVQRLFQAMDKTKRGVPPGPATILVNCAGITRDGWIGRMSLEQWQEVQNVNLTGTFLCCREFLNQPQLLQQQGLMDNNKLKKGGGRDDNNEADNKPSSTTANMAAACSIINISSVVATQGNLGQVNYAASKGGVWSLTKALAREVAPRSIRVNCVLPGFIDTEMTQAVPDHVREQIQKKIVYQQRFGTPDDIANLVLFLASNERSGYITGQAIECSGMISL